MKKGFTLIELLGVIILLGIIGLIAIPTINNILNNQRNVTYETQVATIKEASERWAFDNIDDLPKNENESITITLEQLQTSGYLDELVDPRSGQPFVSSLEVTITKKASGYYYSFQE